MKKIYCFLFCSFCVCIANAQNNTDTGFMRSNGKLYVVVAVVATILTGMFIYLINLERKIKKIEKEMPGKK